MGEFSSKELWTIQQSKNTSKYCILKGLKRKKLQNTYIYIYIYIIYNMVYVVYGLSGGSDGKESACNVGDLGQIPELGRLYVYMCVYIYIYIPSKNGGISI